MPDVTTGSRGYKQALGEEITSRKFLSYYVVYSSFIILNYGFLYLLNLAMYLVFLNLYIYYF